MDSAVDRPRKGPTLGLTSKGGPLDGCPRRETNHDITGPERLLFLGDFPRRVRVTFGEHTILDTRRGRLLHESTLLPVLYVPDDDVDTTVLASRDHSTHCPYKGAASYWSAGDQADPAEFHVDVASE